MSIQTSLKLWHVTQKRLNEVLKEDKKVIKFWSETKKELRDTDKLTTIFANLFLNYCALVSDLGKIIETTCQVQQRKYLQKVFDAANKRLIELKNSLCLVALSQFVYLDNFIIERRLIPQDVYFVTPNHLKRDNRDPEMQELFEKIMCGVRIYTPPPEPEDDENEDKHVTIEEPEQSKHQLAMPVDDQPAPLKVVKSMLPHENPNISAEKRQYLYQLWFYQQMVILIQTAERVRVARIDTAVLLLTRRINIFGYRQKVLPPIAEQNIYAIKIQKFWRGYYTRKVLREESYDRQVIMGLKRPSWRSSILQENIKKDQDRKDDRRRQYLQNLKEFAEKEETRILRARKPSMMEDITDEIIEWMITWYERTNWFDAFPEVVDGGSVLIVTGVTKFIDEYLQEKAEAEALAERYALDPKLKQKDKEEAKKKKEEEKRKLKEWKKKMKQLARERKRDLFPLYKWEITPGIETIQEEINNYTQVWGNVPLEENPLQDKLYTDFVSEEIYAKLNVQLRAKIDEIMRIEYDILIQAVNADRAAQRLPALPKPKYKPPKQKKKKVPKDLTADRTIEDLFQELIDNGIIHSYPKVSFDDFISDYNYAAYDKLKAHLPAQPGTSDAVAAIKTCCVLPLGSPDAPRSKGVLIFGPRQSGKKLLINAILNETGSVLFDLSPPIMYGKYTGKSGTKMIVHLVAKMSRILQPAVIFIDGAEKPFCKKVLPEDAPFEPKKLGSTMTKLAKEIKSDAMVMFISCSKMPWNSAVKKMLKIYEEVVFVPRLEYGTCYQFWQRYLMSIHGVQRDIDISSITKKTALFELPYLRKCANNVLTMQRKSDLYTKPLKPQEIIYEVITNGGQQVLDPEYAPFLDFPSKTPYGAKDKKRQAFIQLELERERKKKEAEAKKNKK